MKWVNPRELGPGGVQRYLTDLITLHGGMYDHFVSPGKKGVPDLIVTWPAWQPGSPRIHLVETKKSNGGAKSWQVRDHEKRSLFGVHVYIIRNRLQADLYVATQMYPALSATPRPFT